MLVIGRRAAWATIRPGILIPGTRPFTVSANGGQAGGFYCW